MTSRRWLPVVRVAFALLGFSAVVTELATLVERGAFRPTEFFSYFTVQTNLLVVVVLLATALTEGRRPRLLDRVRGATTVYMVVVLVVFAVLLAPIEGVALTAVPWDNTVLHQVVPVVVLLDWVVDPPAERIPWRVGLLWLAYPLLYAAWALVRGLLDGWYPYPFLDPDVDGYAAVAVAAVLIAVGSAAVAWLVTRLPRRPTVRP
ncbi:Pr6Pr family membrane protein [Nocardioides scoriae]|uniref:Pr6Pr family membrane protein n=1 Tax=Nocardioides scoriae TaxID=642780 RepID=UPI000B88991E|nr:Pr6Pr family membrane protein [Nocardioides scoriae]